LAAESAVLTWFEEHGLDRSPAGSGLIFAQIKENLLRKLCSEFRDLMTRDEFEQSRLMIKPADHGAITPRDLLTMTSARSYIARIQGEWLTEMIRSESMDNVFQPLVDPVTFEIKGYECLMRGRLPNGARVMPAHMLETARDMGLILQLDRLARTSALRNASRQNVLGLIFINFSPTAVDHPEDCLESTVDALVDSGVDPGRVVFEVTESERVADAAHLTHVLRGYRDAGFQIALDDLGAGYSGLNMLTQIRPDYVKLDMNLIRNIDQDVYKQHVTRSILEMAQHLCISTVVEGVESAQEWQWAADHGACLIQGFHYAKPAYVPPTGPDDPAWRYAVAAITHQRRYA
jgi:EAL domain-containing protein (putative c-di-GMP-specific phosphodiesterase class I)